MSIVMTVLSNLGLILKFWDKIEALIGILQDTPEEQHRNIILAAQIERERLRKEGRPSWDS